MVPAGPEKPQHCSVACMSTLPRVIWPKVAYITTSWLWVLLYFYLPAGKQNYCIFYPLYFEGTKLEQRIHSPGLETPKTKGQWVNTTPAFTPTGAVLGDWVQERVGLAKLQVGAGQWLDIIEAVCPKVLRNYYLKRGIICGKHDNGPWWNCNRWNKEKDSFLFCRATANMAEQMDVNFR